MMVPEHHNPQQKDAMTDEGNELLPGQDNGVTDSDDVQGHVVDTVGDEMSIPTARTERGDV